jgi:hypothetical protein
MSRRIRLPNRRESETFGLEAQGLKLPPDVIRRALMRDVKGRASGPLATALDMLAERDQQQ